MSKENITFRVESEKRKLIDEIALAYDRDRSYIINQALERYLEIHQWQVLEIKEALVEAEKEDFSSDEAVEATLKRLTNED